MVIFEALQSFFIALLVSYLTLTNAIAEKVELLFPTEEIPTESGAPIEPSDELISISKLFANGEGVAQLLRTDTIFQEAFGDIDQEASVSLALEEPLTEEEVVGSLVNILCQYKTEEYTRTTTGTGFFVNEDGVILTNAHVAQFLLLEAVDTSVEDAECVVRSGNPAIPRYEAELLFISPTWILNNAELITAETPRGTGEYDYALLYVSEALGEETLPDSYESLPINTEFLSRTYTGSTVLTAGYPAEKLLREGTRAKLEPKIAQTTIEELYTFGSNYADIFAVSASQVGEQGASGGPVVDPKTGAIGLIVTKGNIEADGVKSLRALTLSYINRTIMEETGFSLEANASGNLPHRGKIFKDALVPFLAQLLSFELEH